MVRVIPPAIVTGQAAGIAAAVAKEDAKDIRDVDEKKLRAKLRKEGFVI